jgi:cytochrome P450
MVTLEKLKKYTPIFFDTIVKTIENEIKISNIVDLPTFLSRITFIAFCQTYFDVDLTKSANVIMQPLNNVLRCINNALDPIFIPIGEQYNEYKKNIKIIHDYMENLIDQVIDHNKGDVDILNILGSDGMTKKQLIQFMISIVLGGHETTSKLLVGIICSLIKDNNMVNRLRGEINDYFSTGDDIKYDIVKLEYLKYIVNEGSRLYPPVWICSREPSENLYIDDFVIEKGTQIMISPLIVHRDKNIWGNDAEEFRPERFENIEGYKNSMYFPFLIGPENCTGKKLAILEACSVIVALFKDYNIQIIDDTIDPISLGTFRITNSYKIKIIPISK